MPDININIITGKEKMPAIGNSIFFHSREFFEILSNVPRVVPFMVVASDGEGRVVANMLCVIRRTCLLRHGHIFGEGAYSEGADKNSVYALMIEAATKKFRNSHCIYIEVSGISTKMFGYGSLRSCGFFPVRWMEIHNTLQKTSPAKRLLPSRRKRILRAAAAGVKTYEMKDDKTFKRFFRMLKHFFIFKFHRFKPHMKEVHDIGFSKNGKIFVTKYKDRVIGGCTCIYSGGDAYLWLLAAKRKTFSAFYPSSQVIWHALENAHQNNIRHFHFMDVGMPFSKSPFRDFILSFGGKPVSSYRWFRCSSKLLNRILSKQFSS